MRTVETLFSVKEIESITQLSDVLTAYKRLSTQNSVYFTIPASKWIKDRLADVFGLDLSLLRTIPCRWIKGDTPAHIDRGQRSFESTYLVYLTDSEGIFQIGEESYSIEAGTGFSFSEGVSHEVVATNGTSRLLLGPMSEQGFAVGGANRIEGPGGTTAYVRQSSGTTQVSYDNIVWNDISFPIELNNSSLAAGIFKVYITTDLTLSSTNDDYFSFVSDKIQVGNESLNSDGTRPTITVLKDDYDGVFYNGASGTNGKNQIYIYNLIIDGTGKLTQISAGWVTRQYFGRGATNNYIINCSSKGTISAYAGGIVARYTGTSSGSVTLIGCSSTGQIDDAAGGIAGASCENVTCSQCFSEGPIDQNAGGIFGQEAGTGCSAIKCYSTGSIALGSGGIIGASAADGVTAEKCYSTGAIGTSAGGIFGNYAATTIAINCYSTGTIGASAGGIFGNPFGNPGIRTATNCYSANNSWSDATAKTNLTGTPLTTPGVGTTWASIASNTAYELANFGATPYQVQTISGNALIQSKSQSVEQGSGTIEALGADASGNSFAILEKTGGDAGSYDTITISAQTGKISTTTATAVGTYTLYVRSVGSYYITSFVLTVTASSSSTSSSNASTCCKSTMDERDISFEWINDYRIGNRLIAEHSQNPNLKFNGYSEYVKYKMAQAARKS